MTRFAVILENAPDSELERVVIDLSPEGDSAEVDDAISDVIDGWILAVGDTIKIREVA